MNSQVLENTTSFSLFDNQNECLVQTFLPIIYNLFLFGNKKSKKLQNLQKFHSSFSIHTSLTRFSIVNGELYET